MKHSTSGSHEDNIRTESWRNEKTPGPRLLVYRSRFAVVGASTDSQPSRTQASSLSQQTARRSSSCCANTRRSQERVCRRGFRRIRALDMSVGAS